MPKGTWKRSDKHPTSEGLIFDRYNGSREVWTTLAKMDAKRSYEKMWRRRDRGGSEELRKVEYNTGSERGTFHLWDKHPTRAGMFFYRYQVICGNLRESWCNQEKMGNAKDYEKIARLNRRAAIEGSELAEGDEALILAFYAIRDIKNNAHGRIMYHVDHRIPLARNGTHHPSNLQLATASWNLRKGKKLCFENK